MSKHVYWHAALTDVAERAGGVLSRMKVLVNFFTNESPNIAYSKDLIKTEIPMLTGCDK